jgi:dTDP-4-amino-4,6-dideoxygalactose transaminase
MSRRTVPPARIVFSPEDRTEILRLVDEALTSGQLTLGPRTDDLERSFARRHGGLLAVATSSGTSALEIILRAAGVAGRDVVVPANTFFATAAAVVHAGARPRFADISGATLALTAETVEAALTAGTAAVIHVHIGGLISPEIDDIRRLCERAGVILIEDAAHAHGSSWQGKPAGSWSRAAAFSFYPTKVVTAGEGGMILTADEEWRDEARIYRDQGKASFLGGGHVRLGSAWRMSELHATVALVHLRHLDEFIAVRRRVAARYHAALTGCAGITLLPEPAGSRSNFYKYAALLDPAIDRADLKKTLSAEHGVSMSGEVYATPLHHEPVFSQMASGPLPVTEDVCARQICLPVHSDMSDSEVDHVVEALTSVLARARV